MNMYIIRNTMSQAVGLYTPSTLGYYGVIELISDYAGIKHSELCKMVAPEDQKIGTVRCNTNVAWLDEYVKHPPTIVTLTDSPYLLPVADSLDIYLSAEEVCTMFKITRRTLSNWHQKFGLSATKRGNDNLYHSKQIKKLKDKMGMK